jgi:hypothetical protein
VDADLPVQIDKEKAERSSKIAKHEDGRKQRRMCGNQCGSPDEV